MSVLAPVIFALFGFWYGSALPAFWPMVAVFVGTGTLGIFRGLAVDLDEGGVFEKIAELIGRYCWVPFALGAIIGAFFRVLR